MTNEEALKEINGRLRFGSKLGLHNITALLNEMGNPQKDLKFVHVAGTNGKGTTCTYIASALRKAGYRVGLYTSPYVVDFRERFVIDGEMIPEDELTKQVEFTASVCNKMEEQITEFEFITALAMNWFKERECDIVVLEVGLGGRFDATNVIDVPEVAVIAHIALDHTQYLGDTIEQIAFEKAGIIKNGGTVAMYGAQDEKAMKVFEDICKERNAELVLSDISTLNVEKSDLFGSVFTVNSEKYEIPFSGIHQVYNAVNAINALKLLNKKGFTVTEENIKEGLSSAQIFSRMEILSKEPLILLDGGHNPDCAEALKKVIEENFMGKDIIGIMGMMADKDVDNYLSEVVPFMNKCITVMPDNPRSMTAEDLASHCAKYCKEAVASKNNEEAVNMAKDYLSSHENAALIICGSFYMAGEIRPLFV